MKLKKKAAMARRVRRTHTPEFKARVALAAVRDDNQRMEAPARRACISRL
jgi:transposase-like protein